MQINISKFMGIVTGVVTLSLVGCLGYLSYTLFFSGEAVEVTPTLANVNVGILGPKMQKSAAALINASDKIALKKGDIVFTESNLFKSFTEIPSSVPLSESRGRPDPFVPYVAP